MRKRSWSIKDLQNAAKNSTSIRQTIKYLGLVEAGGNYVQIKKYLDKYEINTSHFTGSAWNKGKSGYFRPFLSLDKILVKNNTYQSFKLKRRLFREGIKLPKCEECSWARKSEDDRLPLELDHINGDRFDNRIENLRILCPNCHSLKLTHRGLNRKR